jgi:hemolysin III
MREDVPCILGRFLNVANPSYKEPSPPGAIPITDNSFRPQSLGEEIANSVSHGLGLLAAIAATPVLIVTAVRRGDPAGVIAVSVFSATMITVYLSSALYHALPPGRAKNIVQHFDHGAIYLLIAGTYTPFTLGILCGPWGWTLLGIVWGLAFLGLLMERIDKKRARPISTYLYLAMGWVAVIAIRPLWLNLPRAGLYWMFAGGLAYTGGVIFYAADHIPYAHFIWHLCVLAGSICFFVAVLGYTL